jgi:hypothetical protein
VDMRYLDLLARGRAAGGSGCPNQSNQPLGGIDEGVAQWCAWRVVMGHNLRRSRRGLTSVGLALNRIGL